MMKSLLPLVIGLSMDLLIGDPHEIPHPVVWIGKLIAGTEKALRKIFPGNPSGERTAGIILWFTVVIISTGISLGLIQLCEFFSENLRIAAESIMVWQILAIRSLRDESMKVYHALKTGDISGARKAVSMIVGRDTETLDDLAVTRAAVETIAENTSDGIIAPLFFLALGGAPAGFFYKAANTMDSMIGYIDPPYTHLGWFAAKMDDLLNFIPARLSALLMLCAGWLQRLDVQNGWKIFLRDRYKHASPNSAQNESVCAGLLDIRLAGDARYHGILHKKEYIGDPIREIEYEDIPRTCALMYAAALIMFLITCAVRLVITG